MRAFEQAALTIHNHRQYTLEIFLFQVVNSLDFRSPQRHGSRVDNRNRFGKKHIFTNLQEIQTIEAQHLLIAGSFFVFIVQRFLTKERAKATFI